MCACQSDSSTHSLSFSNEIFVFINLKTETFVAKVDLKSLYVHNVNIVVLYLYYIIKSESNSTHKVKSSHVFELLILTINVPKLDFLGTRKKKSRYEKMYECRVNHG